MKATFRFFETGGNAGPWRQEYSKMFLQDERPKRRLVFRCDEAASFDRGNYRGSPVQYVEIGARPPPPQHRSPDAGGASNPRETSISPAAGIELEGRLIRKARGGALTCADPMVFITTCQIGSKQAHQFLAQFNAAAEYMKRQPGFVRLHLFERTSGDEAYRFINVAEWTSMGAFTAAFKTSEFRGLTTGGFDQTSEIIVAKLDRAATIAAGHC